MQEKQNQLIFLSQGFSSIDKSSGATVVVEFIADVDLKKNKKFESKPKGILNT